MLHVLVLGDLPVQLANDSTLSTWWVQHNSPDVIARFNPLLPTPPGFQDRIIDPPRDITAESFQQICLMKHADVIRARYQQGCRPLVSVFTPWANPKEAWVNEAWNGLLAQTYTNWEWVCLGPGKVPSEPHARFRHYSADVRPLNVGAAKNDAASLCHGSILVELDHDDVLTPRALEAIVEAFTADPDLEFIHGNSAWFRDGTREPVQHPRMRHTERVIGDVIYQERHQADLFTVLCETPGVQALFGWWLPYGPIHPMAFTRKAFNEVGGYHPAMKFAEDWELMARFMVRGKCKHIPELLYLYRINADSDGRQNSMYAHSESVGWHLGEARLNLAPLLHEAKGIPRVYGASAQARGADLAFAVIDTNGDDPAAALWLDEAAQQYPLAERLLIRNGDFDSQIGLLAQQRELLIDAIEPGAAELLAVRRATRPILICARNHPDLTFEHEATARAIAQQRKGYSGLDIAEGVFSVTRQSYLESHQRVFPGISVVISTYKRTYSGLLARALDSVRAQTYDGPIEIIVVGDGCPELASRLGDPFLDGVRVYNLAKNHDDFGSAAKNHGILQARHAWIAYLDDDNDWLPNHLATVMDAIKACNAAWGCSSIQVEGMDLEFNGEKLGRLDTSAIVHRAELPYQYGFWRPYALTGYGNDWDFVARFIGAGLAPAATLLPTVRYNIETERPENAQGRQFIRDTLARKRKGALE